MILIFGDVVSTFGIGAYNEICIIKVIYLEPHVDLLVLLKKSLTSNIS
jgi:hypothetical protein